MSALRKPVLPTESSPRRQRSRRKKRAAGYHPKANKHRQAKSATITSADRFTALSKLPVKLQVLLLLQRGSFGLALISMAASVGLYISTVKIPQVWSQEYKNLESLQRQERQLTAINETLKYQLAKQAGQQSQQSASVASDQAIFITPAKVKITPEANQPTSDYASAYPTDRQLLLKHSSWGY